MVKINNNSKLIKYGPVVCAVEDNYQVMIPSSKRCTMTLTVGNQIFCNSVNGVKKTDCKVHSFTIPQKLLDKEKSYTVTAEAVFSSIGRNTVQQETFSFQPVINKDKLCIYHISDTHGMFSETVTAANTFRGNIDLLILNGDISSSSNKYSDILLNYKIAFAITKGNFPCIITRGNHDLRGCKAQYLNELLPSSDGKHYYFTSLSDYDFLILDCGEDKDDSHREYEGLADFHTMRAEETEFLRERLYSYSGKDNKNKTGLVISHIPFNYCDNGESKGERPFNIENELYAQWCDLINSYFAPKAYLVGHLHRTEIWNQNHENNHRNLACHTIIGSKPFKNQSNKVMCACHLSIEKNEFTITFNDSDGNTEIHKFNSR